MDSQVHSSRRHHKYEESAQGVQQPFASHAAVFDDNTEGAEEYCRSHCMSTRETETGNINQSQQGRPSLSKEFFVTGIRILLASIATIRKSVWNLSLYSISMVIMMSDRITIDRTSPTCVNPSIRAVVMKLSEAYMNSYTSVSIHLPTLDSWK